LCISGAAVAIIGIYGYSITIAILLEGAIAAMAG
jgi:hypothetical protein